MTMMAPVEQEARRLAGLEGFLDDQLKGVQLRQAAISSYDSGTGLATITLGGDTTPIVGVPSLSSYTPNASDTGVWVAMIGTSPLLVGATGAASPPVAWADDGSAGELLHFGTINATITSGDLQTASSHTFGITLPTTPEVLCQITDNPANPVFWEVTARSTTGFTIHVGKISLTTFGASGSYRFSYIAIG
jgi:hypothetical protein